MELTSVFGIFANEGRMFLGPISKIVDATGEVFMNMSRRLVIRWFERSMPADHRYSFRHQCPHPDVWDQSVINLPFTAAVKTGTTNDFRDNWTIGYTSDLVRGHGLAIRITADGQHNRIDRRRTNLGGIYDLRDQ